MSAPIVYAPSDGNLIDFMAYVWQQTVAGGGHPASVTMTQALMQIAAQAILLNLRNATVTLNGLSMTIDYWVDGALVPTQINAHTAAGQVFPCSVDPVLPEKTAALLNGLGTQIVLVIFP